MKTILVVDDLPIFREPIEIVLRTEGYNVVTACNGVEALAAFKAHHPDLVLLDLSMPVMDGIAALRRIREDDARTPVLVLTAEADRGLVVDARALGISGYLLKSTFSLRTMLKRVQGALESPVAEARGVGAVAAAKPASNPKNVKASLETSADAQRTTGSGSPVPPARAAPSAPATRSLSATAGTRCAPTYSADLKSLKPLVGRSELLEIIGAEGELKGFSPTVSQILQITGSPRCTVEQVAKAVSQDHAVALKVLKLANSSIYSRGDRVDTVQKAVLRIGLERIRQTVLNIGVVERFSAIAFDKHLSTPQFWEHSIACGIIGAEIAHALGHKQPDTAFTAGLLHDLGRVLLAERLGERYIQVLETAGAMHLPVEMVESRMLMMNHADVMDRVLHAWRFPKELINPIVLHHKPPAEVKAAAPHQTAEVLRLQLADRLAHAMMLGSSGNDTVYPTEEICALLKIQPETIRAIEDSARRQTDDTKFSLLSSTDKSAWKPQIEQHQAQLRMPLRALYLSASPALDAYRIFCDCLGGTTPDGPAQVAIVHLTSATEQAVLSGQLIAEEQRLGVRGLPLMVLSPTGELNLEASVLDGREARALKTPLTIATFAASVNDLLPTVARAMAA